ncbi:ACP S-malonyltransferase [Verrucomicrobiota bacterium]
MKSEIRNPKSEIGSKAIVFAGQGAQFVGMGKDLAETYPACKELFNKADEVLGYEISKICFEGPAEELTKSNHCQPAIFTASIACYKALCIEKKNISFNGAAGLSLGEWSALHMAGAITFEDALRVLEARGRFMQEACEERDGAMVGVIGLPEEKVREIASSCGVGVANLNSPGQTVLSGERKKIQEAEKLAKDAGAKRAIVLNVAGAYHSSLMEPAAKRLDEFLAEVKLEKTRLPVVSNVTGLPHGEPGEIRENMVKQVTSSVQWVSSIQWFKNNGITEYAECGPGKVLSGLIRRLDKEAKLNNIQDVESLKKMINDE